MNQSLQQAKDRSDIICSTALHLKRLLQRDIVIYPVRDGKLENAKIFYINPDQEADKGYSADSERAIALWVLKNNKHAGATTQTMPNACILPFASTKRYTVWWGLPWERNRWTALKKA